MLAAAASRTVAAVCADGTTTSTASTGSGSLQVTYPVGLEDPSTRTCAALTQNFKGSNPFPVDVVVGKDGIITDIAREYDPDGITAAVEAALAK